MITVAFNGGSHLRAPPAKAGCAELRPSSRGSLMSYDPKDKTLAPPDPNTDVTILPSMQVDKFVEERVARLDKAATLSALEELKALPPNWSGYGASPIDHALIHSAREFISALPCDLIATPKVVPMTRGRLQFEWHRGNRSLELEFESSDRIHYLKWDSGAGIEEEDTISVNDRSEIHALLRWFALEPVNV
jgi:hypothetical protein